MNPSLPIKILIVDDHPLMRAGLCGEINAQPNMKVVAEASDGKEAMAQFRTHRPDVTLMDLRMPNADGIDAIHAIRGEYPDARIVVLTTASGDAQVLRALRAGAVGYLLKNLLRTELIETIRVVHAGQKRIPPEIAIEIAEHAFTENLTDRELDVLEKIAKGRSNKIIASDLGISEHTVKNHLKTIFAKLDARDRTHAVTIALKRGFIDL